MREIIGKDSKNNMEDIEIECSASSSCGPDEEHEDIMENHTKRLQIGIISSSELNCDLCHTKIGYVDESDLNGSYFFCVYCKLKSI